MNGVAHDRQQPRGRLFFVANPDSDEPRSPVAMPPPAAAPPPPHPSQPHVRLLPPITTAPALVYNLPPLPSSSGSSSDRSSPTLDTSASSPSPITPDSPTPKLTLTRHNLLVMATSDNNYFLSVDLSGATTGASIREIIYSAVSLDVCSVREIY